MKKQPSRPRTSYVPETQIKSKRPEKSICNFRLYSFVLYPFHPFPLSSLKDPLACATVKVVTSIIPSELATKNRTSPKTSTTKGKTRWGSSHPCGWVFSSTALATKVYHAVIHPKRKKASVTTWPILIGLVMLHRTAIGREAFPRIEYGRTCYEPSVLQACCCIHHQT